MRADRPLLVAVISLGWGLGLIIGYCKGATAFNAAYPLSGSMLHLELTTIGPGVLGGIALIAIGVVFLVWAFIAAIVSLFSPPREQVVDHVVERYSVVPPVEAAEQEAPTGTEGRPLTRLSTRTRI